MAEEVTELQKQLISALLDSGITKDAIIDTIDSMLHDKAQLKHQPIDADCKLEPAVGDNAECMSYSGGSSDGDSMKGDYNEEISQPSAVPLLTPESIGDHLLRMDPWQSARVIRMYMQQHNIPQREVVETTGLNQSHLSQHLNKGTPMKSQKRAILYGWFERKQREMTLQYSNPDKKLFFDDDESPSKRSRRNRFKWGPASTNLLYKSYEQQRNPSKEEREALVIQCNKAECEQRGVPYSNVGGLGPNLVTENRVYNWFANRRKEETFRMKLAIEAASYQDTPNQTITSPLSTNLSPIAPKMTFVNCSTPQQSTVRPPMTLPVHTSYATPTSSMFHSPVIQTISAASPAVCSSQVLPSVGTLMKSASVENDGISSQRVVMPTQSAGQSLMLTNNITNGGSPQFAASPQLPAITIPPVRPHQLIPPNASQALQAMASTIRQITVQPIPITTIPSVTTAYYPHLMTPVSVPSVTVSHIARSPVATIEHLATQQQRSRDDERQGVANPGLVVQEVRKQIPLETHENCLSLPSEDGHTINNGEHVIHHMIQPISPAAKADEIEKEFVENKTEDAIDELNLDVKMEINGAGVDDVDSIAETVTVETTSSTENTPVKDSKNDTNAIDLQSFCKPTKAVIVQVNGNHDDSIVS